MFFVTKYENGKFGVIDIDDAKIDFYTPEELIKIVRNGVKVYGVRLDLNSAEISVVEPSRFIKVNSFLFENDSSYDYNKEFNNKLFYDMVGTVGFDKIFTKEAFEQVGLSVKHDYELRCLDVGNDYLLFEFWYNFKSRYNNLEPEYVEKVLNNNPYFKDKLKMVLNISNILSGYQFKMQLPSDIINTICVSLDYVYKYNIHDLVDNGIEVKDNILIECHQGGYNSNSNDYNISLFFIYDGIKIPLIVGARDDFIQKKEARDSYFYYSAVKKYLEDNYGGYYEV